MAVSTLLGRKHGRVGYLANELGICSQAVSRWKTDEPIPRVHRLYLRMHRQDLIEITERQSAEDNSTANEAA